MAVAELAQAKEQLKEMTAVSAWSTSTERIHLMRVGSTTSSVKEGLDDLSKEVHKVFKRALDELDTIKESVDRLGVKGVKEKDNVDLVGNDKPG